MKRVLVLTDHMPWGHRSIAKAIYGFLKSKEKEEGLKVDYAEVKAETGFGGDMYTLAYRYFPSTNKITMKLAQNRQAARVMEVLSVLNLPRLKKTIRKYKPDLVISAYFLHSHSLAAWRKKEGINFKLWTVVADPWTINPISFVKDADLHLVYDEVGVKIARKYGIDSNKVMVTGWWVRQDMYRKYDRLESRKKLGFMDDRPLIFVGGGSLGNNSLFRVLPVLMYVKKPVGMIFNTGTDRLAYNTVAEYDRMFKRLRKDGEDLVQIKNLGWIDNMAEVLAGCDLVLGKAGPNFLFDVMAAEKPFVAITHIGGQEDGNIELIIKKRLGWVREKNGHIGSFLLKYLDNPEKYNLKYIKEIRKEAGQNQKTWEKILEKIRKEG